MSDEVILALTLAGAVADRLSKMAADRGAAFLSFPTLEALTDAGEPSAVVVDLDLAGEAVAPAALRARWPGALLAAFVSVPDRARWEVAQTAGYDLVTTRGAIAQQLARALETWEGPRRARRVRLFDAADAAGRIGLVHRADTPVGRVAVYHLGAQLFGVSDVCPHAGATLSEGELAGPVITCPLHGSQFDVRTGERVRGPADREITVYPVVVESGTAYLEID